MTAVKIEEHTINDRMQVDETKRLMLPTIRWGAIFAGWSSVYPFRPFWAFSVLPEVFLS